MNPAYAVTMIDFDCRFCTADDLLCLSRCFGGSCCPPLEGDLIWVRWLLKRFGEGILQIIWRAEFLKSSYVMGIIPFSNNINIHLNQIQRSEVEFPFERREQTDHPAQFKNPPRLQNPQELAPLFVCWVTLACTAQRRKVSAVC
jgi:hypothetical protein